MNLERVDGHVMIPSCSSVQFSSVQFSSSYELEKAHMCSSLSLKSFPVLPLKQFQCLSDWWWPSLVLSRKILFLFQHLSPPGSRWCDVLGFVSAGSVSSSSTLQIFWGASHLCWLLFPPVYLFVGHFPSLWHVKRCTSTGVFKAGCQPVTHSNQGFPFHCSLLFVCL